MTSQRGLMERWARWATSNPGRAIIVALAITALLTIGVARLRLEMTFYSIMPDSSEQVRDLRYITEQFPFSSAIMAVVDARGYEGEDQKETIIRTIEEIEASLSGAAFSEFVDVIYGGIDPSFASEHGLMLVDTADMDRLVDLYQDTNLLGFLRGLNVDLEREYSGDGGALEDDEAQVVAWVNGLEEILSLMNRELEGEEISREEVSGATNAFLLGDPYLLSNDEQMGLLMILPTYTVNDIRPMVEGTTAIESEVKRIADANGVHAGITGLIAVGRDEMVTSEQGFATGMTIAIILIIALLVIVFRLWSTPLIIGLPLVIGIYWTAGLAGFLVSRLSIVTAMYMVALVGLGVDYAIHMISGFVQERDRGASTVDAVGLAFRKSGRGIVTGALTTAAAFISLVVADSGMIRELAVVASAGILAELVAMFLLVPAIVGVRERRLIRHSKPDPLVHRKQRIRSDFGRRIGEVSSRHPWGFIAGLAGLAVVLGIWSPRVSIEDNLMEMEAEGLESVELQDTLVEEFGLAPDSLFLITRDTEDLPTLVDDLEDLASVRAVEAVTTYVPTAADQAERRPFLEEIRRNLSDDDPTAVIDVDALLEELYRLEINLVEMGDLSVLGGNERLAHALNGATGLDNDGNKVERSVFDRLFEKLESEGGAVARLAEFQQAFSPELNQRIFQMANPDAVTMDDLPRMIRSTYQSRDGAANLVTIFPRQNPWVGSYRNIFTTQVESVTSDATGMILAADEMTRIAQVDGIRSMIAALIVVFLILLIDFRNLKLTLLSFLPLGMAFVSLLGIMAITEIQFDFINIIAIPLLVGIGIDGTVHINHRYLQEGRGGLVPTLAGTGTAILMTAVTTMIGFGSFIPSLMRALRSTGIVLTVAIALAFAYSVLFHPTLLMMVNERFGWNLKPWGSRDAGDQTRRVAGQPHKTERR